ncbi:MAG TPA: ABC transporter ATP-binding protein [Thermoclostridium sp.]
MNHSIILQLDQIKKSFGGNEVLKGINLSINQGEFITLLGSSGCGKTTTLRIIAGLETPDSGRVILEGRDVTYDEPNKRCVNTVFQNYALFPHMTVEANIGYSLKLKRVDKATIKRTVEEALELVQLKGYGKRMPHELSGGEQQRVAIARAVVNQPKVLLLDEPLGALDLQLRRQMQTELKRLQTHLGITFLYITHDQEEALNMSDRIAVMRAGVFEQVGSPADIYDRPKTSYVAKFVGSANIIYGRAVTQNDDMITFTTDGGMGRVKHKGVVAAEQPVTVAVRRESIRLIADEQGNEGIKAVVREKTFAGGLLQIVVTLINGSELVATRHGINSELKPGDHVLVTWNPENAVLVDTEE